MWIEEIQLLKLNGSLTALHSCSITAFELCLFLCLSLNSALYFVPVLIDILSDMCVKFSAYLLLGLTFVMLLLNLYNDIPQLNLGHFLLRGVDANTGDPERMRLSGTGGVTPKYTQVSS